VFEVPAGVDGTVLKLIAAAGDDVPILQPIAIIGASGEAWQSLVSGSVTSADGSTGSSTAGSGSAISGTAATGPSTGTPDVNKSEALDSGSPAKVTVGAQAAAGVSPRARKLAEREVMETAGLAGSGPGGRVIERDVQAALEKRPPLSAAAKAGLTASSVLPGTGSGMGGRVLAGDLVAGGSGERRVGELADKPEAIENAIPGRSVQATDFPGSFRETPVKGIRKVIAERMRESLSGTAQFTVHAAARAKRLQELRARLKAAPEALGFGKVTVGDIVLFITARVLADHPMCNSRKEGDTIKTYERVHLGLAVDTPRGLMVPVIRDAEALSLSAISAEAKRLASACLEGKILPDELGGSTFTVSNLGALGVEYFTPVINAPEVCVLGLGAILPKPFEASDGTIGFEPAMGLSLTADHQVVDGAPAARFLRDLCTAIADADLWLAK
jgi:pyruvate dehydrogenase E2 component (dihydrolipoamide acetyltransferase)